jgi:hypothetical protein
MQSERSQNSSDLEGLTEKFKAKKENEKKKEQQINKYEKLKMT